MVGRLRREHGATSAEYMGVLALAAAIVFLLVTMPVGDRIAREVERLVCEIANGGTCPAEEIVDASCLLSSDTRSSSFSVTVAVVKVGGGATLIKEVFADGRTVFTLVDDAEVAAELIAGARARVGKLGFNASASLSAGGRLKGARVFELRDPEAIAEFERKVRNAGTVRDLLHKAVEGRGVFAGPIPLPDLFGVRDGIADFLFGEDADDLPDPTATYIDTELLIKGEAQLGAGVPGFDANLDGLLEGAGGAKVITSGPDAGNVELHYGLSAQAAGDLGLVSLGPGIGGDAAVTMTLTLSSRGGDVLRPVALEVAATAGYSGSPLDASQLLRAEDLEDLSAMLEKVNLVSRDGSGQMVEFTGRLDLTNAANRNAALAMLAAGANPALTGPAAVDLARRLNADGDLTFQTYGTTASEGGVEIAAGIGVGGGVAGSSESKGQELASAYQRPPGGRWTARRCRAS